MEFFKRVGSNAPGQVHHGPDISSEARAPSSGAWLSVPEAVAYCEAQGLRRNIETVRRWAARSLARPESAEVLAREQDTPNGFRHLIERKSLDRKIAQELAFEASRASADASEPVGTGPDMVAPLEPQCGAEDSLPSGAVLPEPDRAPPGMSEPVRRLEVTSIGDDFLKGQIAQKDTQIGELNDQLKRRDEQIMTLLERDRETNLLINGLQQTLSRSLGLDGVREIKIRRGGDSEPDQDGGAVVQSGHEEWLREAR